jgi:hypothetical protein
MTTSATARQLTHVTTVMAEAAIQVYALDHICGNGEPLLLASLEKLVAICAIISYVRYNPEPVLVQVLPHRRLGDLGHGVFERNKKVPPCNFTGKSHLHVEVVSVHPLMLMISPIASFNLMRSS